MAKNADNKLSVRLSTQSVFTGTAMGEKKDCAPSGGSAAADVEEFMTVGATTNDDSWRDICARYRSELSSGVG